MGERKPVFVSIDAALPSEGNFVETYSRGIFLFNYKGFDRDLKWSQVHITDFVLQRHKTLGMRLFSTTL